MLNGCSIMEMKRVPKGVCQVICPQGIQHPNVMQVDVECAMLDGRHNLERPMHDGCSDISSMYSFRPASVASAVPRMMGLNNSAGTTLGAAQYATRPSTAPESNSSAAARQRIERLEAELASAREERIAMQDSVDMLAKEMS